MHRKIFMTITARENMKTAIKLFVALAPFSFTAASSGRAKAHDDQSHQTDDPNWSELIASIDKMHMAIAPRTFAASANHRFQFQKGR
jgi:hypothetical protein